MKTYILKSGSPRKIEIGDYYIDLKGNPQRSAIRSTSEWTPLSLTVLDPDPIMEVYEKYKDMAMMSNATVEGILWKAIKNYAESKGGDPLSK